MLPEKIMRLITLVVSGRSWHLSHYNLNGNYQMKKHLSCCSEKFPINYEVYQPNKNNICSSGSPIIIAHGMLGSAANWSTIAKAICWKSGRQVITFDARNHGHSAHSQGKYQKYFFSKMRSCLSWSILVVMWLIVSCTKLDFFRIFCLAKKSIP